MKAKNQKKYRNALKILKYAIRCNSIGTSKQLIDTELIQKFA